MRESESERRDLEKKERLVTKTRGPGPLRFWADSCPQAHLGAERGSSVGRMRESEGVECEEDERGSSGG